MRAIDLACATPRQPAVPLLRREFRWRLDGDAPPDISRRWSALLREFDDSISYRRELLNRCGGERCRVIFHRVGVDLSHSDTLRALPCDTISNESAAQFAQLFGDLLSVDLGGLRCVDSVLALSVPRYALVLTQEDKWNGIDLCVRRGS